MTLYDLYSFASNPIAIVTYFLSTLVLLPHAMELYSQFKNRVICLRFERSVFDPPNDSYLRNRINAILFCLIMSLLVLFSSRQFVILLGCKNIDVMPNGTYCYYVLATNDNDKTYTLPAKIEKEGPSCYVQNVYFKNGGYLYFEEGELSQNSKTEIFSCDTYDQNGKDWKIELTENRTTHLKVDETNPFNLFKLIFTFCHSMFFIVCVLLNIWHLANYNKLQK